MIVTGKCINATFKLYTYIIDCVLGRFTLLRLLNTLDQASSLMLRAKLIS